MIICSCRAITDHDIERALIEIMRQPQPPLPTPGLVWRHLSRHMNCCGCAPLAIDTIYAKLEELERKGIVAAYVGEPMRGQLLRLRQRQRQYADTNAAPTRLAEAAE